MSKSTPTRGEGGGGTYVVMEKMERSEEEEEVELPGFRFHPTDEELVSFYLRRKVDRTRFSIEIIKEIDIYKHDPWDLPKSVSPAGEREWYFFCLRGRKYRNSIRPNRVTGSGFWKATGIDRPVYSSSPGGGAGTVCIGLKKSLVYYRGSAGKGTKTDWMMHEFRLPAAALQEAEVWTVCRIFKRAVSYRKISWKAAAAANEAEMPPADSGSKSSSLDSDGWNDDKLLVSPSPSNYSASLWSVPMATAAAQQDDSMTAAAMAYHVHECVEPSNPSNAGDLFRSDGNSWDELGRVVEFMTDQNVASSYWRY